MTRLLLVWAEPAEYSSDLQAIFYDPTNQVWGSPKTLTSDMETERNITAVFYGNESLLAVYNRNIIGQITTYRELDSGKKMAVTQPTPIQSDLSMLLHLITPDLALEGGESKS